MKLSIEISEKYLPVHHKLALNFPASTYLSSFYRIKETTFLKASCKNLDRKMNLNLRLRAMERNIR